MAQEVCSSHPRRVGEAELSASAGRGIRLSDEPDCGRETAARQARRRHRLHQRPSAADAHRV